MSVTTDGGGTVQISEAELRRLQRLDRREFTDRRAKPFSPPIPWDLRIFFTIIAIAVLAQVGWLLSGGSLYRVTTASMCPEVCVGSLVIDRPLPANTDVRKGETVSFVPPGLATVYTHRVVKVFANGTFLTKGDAANIVDPWTVSPSDVRGVAVATFWGMGYFSEGLPFLAVGVALVLLLRRQIEARVRRDYDRFFAILIVVVPIWVVKPLIRATTVATSVAKNGYERVALVNTGLLPAQFRTKSGFRDFVRPGQRISMVGKVLPDGQVAISQFVSFHWYGWLIVALVIFVPLATFFFELRYSRLHLRRRSDLPSRRRPAGEPGPALDPSFIPSFVTIDATAHAVREVLQPAPMNVGQGLAIGLQRKNDRKKAAMELQHGHDAKKKKKKKKKKSKIGTSSVESAKGDGRSPSSYV